MGVIRQILGATPALFVICLLVWTLTNMDQSLFGYALPGILVEFALPLEAAGTILTVSFIVAAIVIIPAGILADRYGREVVMVLLLFFSALFVGLQGLAAGAISLTVLRAIGFGLSGGLGPITNAIVVENAAPRYRGIAMGILQCGYPLGWFIASLLAAPLLAVADWRVVCMIGFIVMPFCIPIYLVLRRYRKAAPVGPQPQETEVTLGWRQRVALLFSAEHRRTSLASMVMFFTFGGAYAGSVFFFPTFFVEQRGYTPAEATWLVGLSNGIGIIGYLVAAFVGEFVITRRNVFAIWCVAGSATLLGLLWLSDNPDQDLLWFGVMATLFFGSQAVVAVIIGELYPAAIRASGLAVCASAPLSMGFAVFPLIVPLTISAYGWEMGLTAVVFPLLLIAGLTALVLPNRRSGMAIT